MKRLLIIFGVAACLVLCVFLVAGKGTNAQAENDYLRIHVRANSNLENDQQIKYEVKDAIVKFITPYVTKCVNKEQAIKVMGGLLEEIERVADGALKKGGFFYGAKAEIRREKFPTRVYGDFTLEEGFYDALIMELGTGKGDNWWCCIYPPLCFTSTGGDVTYRSAILELINKFKRNK